MTNNDQLTSLFFSSFSVKITGRNMLHLKVMMDISHMKIRKKYISQFEVNITTLVIMTMHINHYY